MTMDDRSESYAGLEISTKADQEPAKSALANYNDKNILH